MFRNCTHFSSLFSVLLFFLVLNPCNRKSGNNEIRLQGINYISELHKHKLVSPSLLTVLTLQFVPCSSIWPDYFFLDSYSIEQKVYIGMLLTNWMDFRGSWDFFPNELSVPEEITFPFCDHSILPWAVWPSKRDGSGKKLAFTLPDNNTGVTWHRHLLSKWHTRSWMLVSNATWL